MNNSFMDTLFSKFFLLFFFCIGFLSFNVSAVDFVFRADTRSPDEIFRDGFSAYGDNRNLQQHIRGETCLEGTEDSAFISTTSSLSSAVSVARYYFRITPEPRIYIYTIRADSSFYSLEPSVEYLRSRGALFSPVEYQMIQVQREWVTHRIPPQNIREAMTLEYNRRDRTVNIIDQVSNAEYQSKITQSNNGVIPNIFHDRVMPRVLNDKKNAGKIRAFGRLIGACFSSRRSDRIGHKEVNNEEIIFYNVRDIISVILKSDQEAPYAADDWIALQSVD